MTMLEEMTDEAKRHRDRASWHLHEAQEQDKTAQQIIDLVAFLRQHPLQGIKPLAEYEQLKPFVMKAVSSYNSAFRISDLVFTLQEQGAPLIPTGVLREIVKTIPGMSFRSRGWMSVKP